MKLLGKSPREFERSRDSDSELQLLQTLILSISQARSVQTAIGMTLSNVCKTTGWTYGQAWQVRADGKALECCRAWHGNASELTTFRKSVESLTLSPGQSLAGKAWVFKEPVWSGDIQKDGDIPAMRQAREAGFRAGLGIPVLAGDDVVLVLEFFLYAPTPEDKNHIQLIAALAAQLGWLIRSKKDEVALQESLERFELAMRGSRDGLWDAKIPIERDWPIPQTPIFYSRRLKQLLGYKDDEMENVLGAWESRLHPEDRSRVLKAIRDHLEKRLPFDVEYRLRVKNGDYRWFSARGTAVWNTLGKPIRMAGSLRDITERKRMEQSLFQSEKMSAVGQLAAGIAHELNNPLHTILGYAQGMIQQARRPEPLEIPLRTIEKEARRCQTLVQNLLAFARPHKRGISAENPNEMIEEILSLIEAQARVKSIEVVRQVAPNLPPIKVDRDQIRQVLLNLCGNAMDAMPKGGTLTVRLGLAQNSASEQKNVMRFDIQDTGEGIPLDIRHRIFEPFFTTKEVGKGTGLGLSMAYEIVKHHQGEISVSSKIGQGSLFQVLLPVALNG